VGGCVPPSSWRTPHPYSPTKVSRRSRMISGRAVQHASFLFSALLFCEALIYGLDRQMGYGAAVIYVFTTAVYTSVLGALLTFSQTLWYPTYRETTAAWGLTPIEDQQLGGLIMWVPAGLVYLAAGLMQFADWLRTSERRALR
jgi:putative membrane protein